MIKIEENAKFLKDQRARIKNEIAALGRIITDACLASDDYKKYDIVMDIGTAGNNISFRVYGISVNELHNLHCYGLNFYFNQFTFNKHEIIRSANKIVNTVRKMKKLAVKYSKLNQDNKI